MSVVASNILNVSLTPELKRFIDQRVASGQNQSASDVVFEGLRLLENRDGERSADFKALKAKLEAAAAAAERGELYPPEVSFQRIEELNRQHVAKNS